MSILTKVFVFLVLFVAMVKLGMDVTLFSHRIDWKDKWVKAENWRVEIERIKNQEIGELNIHIQNLMTGIGLLQREKEKLEETIRGKDTVIENKETENQKLQEQIAVTQTLLERAQQQLNVQIATVQRLQELVDEYRNKAESAIARAAEAEQKLMELAQEVEGNKTLLAELEKKVRLLSVAKVDIEKQLTAYVEKYGLILGPPTRKIDGKIVSYSRELGAVVLNIGKDDGVLEGMQFSIFRPGKFVARAVTKQVDRTLAVAHIELMQAEPEPGDECTNSLPMSNK